MSLWTAYKNANTFGRIFWPLLIIFGLAGIAYAVTGFDVIRHIFGE